MSGIKRAIGYFTLLAAIILIACSATTLFWNSYETAVDPWQKWSQGVQVVSVIVWEAGAVLAISYCFRHRHFVMGSAGIILLLLAMGYTLSQELRQQAGTQADSAARLAMEASARELEQGELTKAIKRRDYLQGLRRPSEAQEDELLRLHKDIAGFKTTWEARTETVHAEGVPGAALLARWTGLDVSKTADIDTLIKTAFWTMARVFSLPLAVFGLTLLSASTTPVQRRNEDLAAEAVTIQLTALKTAEDALKEAQKAYEAKALTPRKPMVALEKLSGAKANLQEELVSSAPTLSKVETMVENHNSEPEPDPADSAPLPVATTDDISEMSTADDTTVVTGPWEGIKTSRITRADKMATDLKKKPKYKGVMSEHHKRIKLWMDECGERLDPIFNEDGSMVEDKDAPYSTDGYECYKVWHMLHYTNEPMHSKIFSRILAGELDLPKVDKKAGAKRDPKARKLWNYRFQYPSEQRKRATA
jgi:hypothetical protein